MTAWQKAQVLVDLESAIEAIPMDGYEKHRADRKIQNRQRKLERRARKAKRKRRKH